MGSGFPARDRAALMAATGNAVPAKVVEIVEQLALNDPTLKKLTLDCNYEGSGDAVAVAVAEALRQKELLFLHNLRTGVVGVGAIAAVLRENSAITTLSLPGASIAGALLAGSRYASIGHFRIV